MTDPDFRDAFHAHKDVLYRFVCRMTGSANGAEDIVQECFLALWRKSGAYDPNRGTLRAFLLGTESPAIRASFLARVQRFN